MHLKRPLQTAHGTLRERELIAVTLIDEDGVEGHGEAAPLETYDGVSIARVESALARYERVLADAREMNGVQLIEACRRVEDLPQALAAIDMALWDRAGIRAGKPVAELLTDDPVSEVAVNATIGATDRQGAVDQAAEAVEEGFECIKVKVGTGDDTARVAAVRATAGPRTALRLDANGAWTVEEAIRMIDALAPIGLGSWRSPPTDYEAYGRCASASAREWRSMRPRPSMARLARAWLTRCA